MTTRSYRQYCAVAHALDLVGERWGLLVVRELVLGPKRFTDLANGLPGIGTNILSARLKQLERGGVVRRRALPPPAASTVYELTEYGRELEEVLFALGRWGAKSMGPRDPEEALDPEWLAVALKALFRPGAHMERTTFEFRLGGTAFHAVLDGETIDVRTAAASSADVLLECDPDALVALLSGVLPPRYAVATGLIQIEGDVAHLERLVEAVSSGEPEAARG